MNSLILDLMASIEEVLREREARELYWDYHGDYFTKAVRRAYERFEANLNEVIDARVRTALEQKVEGKVINLEPMWEALEKYQPYAEKHGFGEEWLRMTTERTKEAAAKAEVAAWRGAPGAALAAYTAAWATVHESEAGAYNAIADINRAIKQENDQ